MPFFFFLCVVVMIWVSLKHLLIIFISFYILFYCLCVSSFNCPFILLSFIPLFPGFVGHFLLHCTEDARKFPETFLLVPQLD